MEPHFIMSNKTIVQPFKDIRKESFIDGEPYNICYCIGNRCMYCPTDTYCTEDRSGCCLEPHCQSKEGKYCACPDKNENAVKHSVKYEFSQNRTGGHSIYSLTLNQNNIEYFKNVCADFGAGTRQQNPNPDIVQFAAMTLNRASNNLSSSNQYDPYEIVFELVQQKHNYISAPPLKQGPTIIHAETRVLNYSDVENMLKWFKVNRKQSQPQPPSVYLFTYLSPCGNCLNDIVGLKSKHDINKVYVAWHLTYDGMKQNVFLHGLQTLLENGVTVVYNLKGLCFDPKSRRSPPLVQPTLFNTLFNTYKAKFCPTNRELRKSLARLVNNLVWQCKDNFDIDGKMSTAKNIVTCFQATINAFNPKIDPNMNIQAEIEKAVNETRSRNIKLLMSPPLSPNDPTLISNNINDLRGIIGNALCFQE